MSSVIKSLPVRQILGVDVHAATMDQVLRGCEEAIRTRSPLMIGVVNAAKIVNMRRDRLLHDAVTSSDLVLADGKAVVWAGRLLGEPLPERVAGIDLFERLLALASEHGFSVYLLGASQDVLDEVMRRVQEQYPGVRIAGAQHGYFSSEEDARIADAIHAAAPDLLFVAITSPKKELFLARWGDNLNVGVCHGVGGSFDVFAGKVKRAPLAWQRLGLEWLYRVCQEPRRMWKRYLTTNVAFLSLLSLEIARTWLLPRRLRHRNRDPIEAEK